MKKHLIAGLLFFVLSVVLCACGDKNVVGIDEQVSGESVKIIDVDLTDEYYGIGVDKENTDLLDQINEYIKKIQESGELDELIDRYLSGGEPNIVTSEELDKSKDQLVVASTLDFEPFEYGEEGAFCGIDMELVEGLADYLNKELVIINSSFDTMFFSVKQHKCDICIGGISITDERREYVDFSEPYYSTAQVLAAQVDDDTFDDAKTSEQVESILRNMDSKTIVGVENLTTAQNYFNGENDSNREFPITVRGYSDMETAISALSMGECNYVVGDYTTVKSFVDKVNGAE